MADNVGYTPGVGATVAADDIAGALHQRIKLTLGADGVNEGDVSSSNPLPITAPAPLDVQGTVQITTAAPLDVILDGVDSTNPLPVYDEAGQAVRQDMVALLTRMLNYLNAPMGYDKSLSRQRGTVVVESGTVTTVSTVTTVTTVSTVSAVTALNSLDGYNARMQILDNNRTAWAQCVRARIT